VTKISTTRPIAEKLQRPNSAKRSHMVPWLYFFVLEEINALKKLLKPAIAETPRKKNAESLLSTEINSTNSSDKMEDYYFIPPANSRIHTKSVENTHPTTELVVSINGNHQEHMLRALADTDASCSIMFEAYTSKKQMKHNTEDK
jgi:hypothetical protein